MYFCHFRQLPTLEKKVNDRAHLNTKKILIYNVDFVNIIWYSIVLYTSQVLEVIKNTKNDIFSLVSSNLMSIFSPNVGHQEHLVSKS